MIGKGKNGDCEKKPVIGKKKNGDCKVKTPVIGKETTLNRVLMSPRPLGHFGIFDSYEGNKFW